MSNRRNNTIYDKGFTELSIERVTEIDSSVSKQNIDDKDTEANTIFFKQDENIETKKVDELLVNIQKNTYHLLMNSDALLQYQSASTQTYNLFETKLQLLKKYKQVDNKVQDLKKEYYETVNVKKVK
ncbi:hypothetical protein FOG48_03447 [Hanseniaspora uvarum]|nr:hypothetical protein FOG48_03447 [Hanseniaspora uvarum]